MARTALVPGPLPPVGEDDTRTLDGAEIIFHGRVRGRENGTTIVALEYEHYPGMAEKELEALAGEAARKFPIRDLVCLHRIGRVRVGEASMRVVVRSPHREEALDAVAWFISEVKQRVPIWKWAVDSDGNRIPCSSGPGAQSP